MERLIEFLGRTDITNGDVIITALIAASTPYILKKLGLLLKCIYKKFFETNFNKMKASIIKNKENKKEIKMIKKIVRNHLKEYIKEKDFKLVTYSAYAYLKEKSNKTKRENRILQYIEKNEESKIQKFEEVFWEPPGDISKYFNCKDTETIFFYLINKRSFTIDEYMSKI